LRDAHEVGLFQVFEAWERPVEILSEVENLLRDFDDFLLLSVGSLDELKHDLRRDDGIVLLQLLADLQGHVKGADAHQ
jgi:hypothetical protein